MAGVAAEHDIPFLVITAGTRNHFALDLGLDRANPAACLGALTDGVELHVDLGGDRRPDIRQNVSFGAYAEVVQTPAYRDDKLRTTLDTLPDLLQGQRGARFSAVADGETIAGRRRSWWRATPMRRGTSRALAAARGLTAACWAWWRSWWAARGRRWACCAAGTHRPAGADRPGRRRDQRADQIPVGIDGEAVSLPTPVHSTIRPGALRVRCPGPPGGAAAQARDQPPPPLATWRPGGPAPAGGPPGSRPSNGPTERR